MLINAVHAMLTPLWSTVRLSWSQWPSIDAEPIGT